MIYSARIDIKFRYAYENPLGKRLNLPFSYSK